MDYAAYPKMLQYTHKHLFIKHNNNYNKNKYKQSNKNN